jgi:holliday junction DNA helicase RuvA
MIESIRGSVEKTADSIIHLRTGPLTVGILAPGYFIRSVTAGQDIDIPVYLHLQMEGNRVVPLLVGFPDVRDREFFEMFISVSGVGVKAAVKALERPPSRIAAAIATEEYNFLTTLPGIGMKRARQIVAGLQDRMKKIYGTDPVSMTDSFGTSGEARSVLKQLGVPPVEADMLIEKACGELGEDAGTSAIVKRAMRIRSSR